MQWVLFGVLMTLVICVTSQQVPTKSVYWSRSNSVQGRQGIVTNIQVPNFLTTGVQIAKQVPYIEVLKLIEAFLKLKGEIAGRAWTLLNDNSHIIAALRDTLISKISTLHSFTLSALIVLRKVLEFASSLFSNVNVRFGTNGPFVDKTFAFR